MTQQISILLVDDEQDLASLTRRRFQHRPEWRFFFAQNGLDALRVLKKNQEISVVVTDLRMPEMDGQALLDVLQEEYPHILTIVCSAYSDLRNIRCAMNDGAFDFLTKPIDFHDFEATLKKAVSVAVQHRDNARTVQRLKTAIETAGIGITITDPQGEILHTNPAEATMHGYTVKELLGQPSSILGGSGGMAPFDERRHWERDSLNQRKDGSEFPVFLMSDVLHDRAGAPIGRVTVCEDLSGRQEDVYKHALRIVTQGMRQKNVLEEELWKCTR